jgi:hypothetical protein
MKTKLITVTALVAAFFINAVHAGSGAVSLGYGTDTFSKGSLLTEESISASVSYGAEVESLNVEGSVSSFDELSDGKSVYIFSGGVSSAIGDLLNVYVGLEHEEIIDGGSQLDAALELSLNYTLSPYFLILRDTSDNNYVFEGGASHTFDLNFADLTLAGALGNSDRYGIEDNDYYSLGLSLSKTLTDSVQASAGYDRVDSDSIDGEDVLSASFTFSF